MALWLKQEDGTLVEVSGGGGGGSFDGEHVLTGDPGSPPEGWAVGQLLYDGVEDAAGDGGPHDHDEFAPVVHDHDYLPLTGGTLTGDLTVDGNQPLTLTSGKTAGREYGQLEAGPAVTLYGKGDASYPGQVRLFPVDSATGNRVLALSINQTKQVRAYGDLQVDGKIYGTVAFSIVDDIDTRDVLGRAETATMPAPEDEGVDGLTVNEVVTALLLKVKELSAEIKELKGN